MLFSLFSRYTMNTRKVYGMGAPVCSSTYEKLTKPYYDVHKQKLEDIYQSYPRTMNLDRTFIDCPCGTKVRLSSLKYHLCTMKHRKVCGDLPVPEHSTTHLESNSSSSSS